MGVRPVEHGVKAFACSLAVLLGLAAVPVAGLGGPVLPVIPKAKGDQCVEPTSDIRKNHMNYLLHQRDETMHRGVRTKRHSLKECINCHVLPDAQGNYPRVGTKEHFCSSCHTYAAVKIDCFQCHADRPEAGSGKAQTLVEPRAPADATSLEEYPARVANGSSSK